MTTPSPSAPQRLGATYPPYPFWAWTCSRNPEVAEDKGQWHRLTGPLPRGRSWPFYYWLPDQPEKPTCDPRTTPSPAPQWAKPYTEIQELAQAIRRNLQDDACPYVQDDKWVITAAAHALVILDNVELATKHAAAISEENQRLRGEIDQLVMERDHFHDERDALREENQAFKDKLLRWEIEKISTWEAHMKEIGDIMDACGAMDNAQIIPRITALRQWSEQAREAMELMLNQADANADFCRTYTPQSRESARTLLAAHPAQGMEGRG